MTAQKNSIMHIVGSLNPSMGGVSRVVIDLTDSLAENSLASVTLLSQEKFGESTIKSTNPSVKRIIINADSLNIMDRSINLYKAINEAINIYSPTVIHSHGLWLLDNHLASYFSRVYNIPLVISTHGMLEPWALNNKFFKKKLAMMLYQRKDLNQAKVLFATSELEYEGLRSLQLTNPIAMIHNGVKEIKIDDLTRFSIKPKNNTRTVLFLSRVQPKKGLLNLLEAWAQIQPLGWRLVIAGPDENNHLSEILIKIKTLGISGSVSYIGEVYGDKKSEVYKNANLFVLPTYSENYGLVIAEALSYGIPVITTKGAPWSDLHTHGCGWWIDLGVKPLMVALTNAMLKNDEELSMMGLRGRRYISQHNWRNISEEVLKVYQWTLNKNFPPSSLRLA